MERHQGKYALVQFCPVPERLEVLNIGLLMIAPSAGFVRLQIARGQARLERAFGRLQKGYLDSIKASFESRLLDVLSRHPDGSSLAEFSKKRANDIRLSPLLPIAVQFPEDEFAKLFLELVGDDEPQPREPRIRRKLREAFSANKVEQFLDRPAEIDLPEYGLKFHVPYGYQNGCYNLIDGMRLSDNAADGLREAGKKSLEGGLIWRHYEREPVCKRLVVVGDFSKQSNAFFHAVREQFESSNVRLHRLDDMRPLFRDIRENAAEHGKVHGN